MKPIYTLFCSFALLILDSSMFTVIKSSKININSSKMFLNRLKTIQEFSRTPEDFQGQQVVFQESRT